MTTATDAPDQAATPVVPGAAALPRAARRAPRRGTARPGPLGLVRRALASVSALVWTAIVVIPLYWVLVTSLRDQAGFFTASPLALPEDLNWANYARVWDTGFITYLLNSAIVTVGAVVLTVAVSLMAAYVVVRIGAGWTRWYFRLFLLGLAIPLQAVIIPVYLLIIQLGLYDSLLAIVLPSVAFAIPITVLILVSFLRDIPGELYEAMTIDGASDWRLLTSLVLPLARPAIATVAVYDALNVWNGFLFPLILTQSDEQATLPLALTLFRGQFGIDVPATMAAVVLTTLPILVVFVLARRQLVAGLTAGFSK